MLTLLKRTDQGSHKLNTPHGRRPGPRYGCLDAYNSGRSSSRYEGSSASQYSRGGLSAAPARQTGRLAGGFSASMPEPGRRTSSLASGADMHRSTSSSQSIRSYPLMPRASSAFYYDYSEDFEDRPSPAAMRPPLPRAPLAPIPTRVPSAHRASVLNDGFDSCFEAPSERDLALTRQRHAPVKLYQDQVDPGDQNMSPSPMPYRLSEDGYERRLDLPPKNYQNRVGTPNVDRSRPLRRGIYGQPKYHQHGCGGSRRKEDSDGAVELFGSEDSGQENYAMPNGRPGMLQEYGDRSKEGSPAPSPENFSFGALDSTCPVTRPLSALTSRSDKSKVCSIEECLADLASFAPYLDRACEWGGEDNVNQAILQADSDKDLGHDALPHDVPRGEKHTPDGVNGKAADTPGRNSSGFRGHRRRPPVPAIRTSQIPKGFAAPRSSGDGKTSSRSGTTTKLRMKASIPLLVQSPPPLTVGSKNEFHGDNPVVGHASAYLGRDEMGAYGMGRNNQSEPIDTASPDSPCDTGPRARPPDYTAPPVPERTSSEGYHSLRPSNGRLRLRVSRAALNQTYTRPHSSRGQCDGPETPQTSGSFDRGSNLAGVQEHRNQDERDANLLETHDQRLPSAAEETKAPSLHGSAVLGNFRTSLSGRISTSMQPGRSLKKRVSELCVRLTGSSIRSSKGDGASSDTESFPRLLRDTIHEKIEEDPSQPNTFPRQLGKFRGRGSRWLRAARHAVMVACAGSRKH